jgi:hypothetical protein
MSPSNFHAILNGDRKCSLEMINKILSGIRYQALSSTTIVIQAMPTGVSATDVYLPQDAESWPLEGMEDIPTETPTPNDSCSSEKPQTEPTLTQGFLLLDLPDEFLNL